MKIIKCSCGKDILLDDEYFDLVSQYKLRCNGALIQVNNNDGSEALNIANLIIDIPEDKIPDHRNGDFHDNRLGNLREATYSQNGANRGKPSNNTSGFKGVSYNFSAQKWQAQITINGKTLHLGLYITPQEAAARYDRAASHYFGEFARLNS